ncbi:MAG: Crp/Fnr family transcriptional regulator [Candidatus Levybacteria bacterium]|nr:Crp/Fnr family transcriptional regulator [Candidatus Levybacteria bacterium]
MPTQKLAGFFSDRKPLFYKKHEIILRADTPPPGVFYLKKGYVRDFSVSKDGEELSLVVFKPGDFFPFQWILNDKLDFHNLEAMTSVELFRAPKEDFIAFLKKDPDILFSSIQEIVSRLGGLMDRMEHLVFGNAYERVASIIFILAERFGYREDGMIMIPMPISHRCLASLVGMTRETVSVEMKRLEKKGLIINKGRFVYIQNLPLLQKESLVESK